MKRELYGNSRFHLVKEVIFERAKSKNSTSYRKTLCSHDSW
jgi:hypothetical protein